MSRYPPRYCLINGRRIPVSVAFATASTGLIASLWFVSLRDRWFHRSCGRSHIACYCKLSAVRSLWNVLFRCPWHRGGTQDNEEVMGVFPNGTTRQRPDGGCCRVLHVCTVFSKLCRRRRPCGRRRLLSCLLAVQASHGLVACAPSLAVCTPLLLIPMYHHSNV